MDVYNPVYPGLYYFDTFTFTTLGTSGHRGPDSTKGYANAPWRDGDFSIVNGQQKWTVPASGTYHIEAAGAYGAEPGRVVSGDVDLNEGQVVSLLVGQQPTPLVANVADNVTVGGGGGTFVTVNQKPLIVASGGDGGAYSDNPWSQPVIVPFSSGTYIGFTFFADQSGTYFTRGESDVAFQVIGTRLYEYDGTNWNFTFLFANERCYYVNKTLGVAYSFIVLDDFTVRASDWSYTNGTWTKTTYTDLTVIYAGQIQVSGNGETLRIADSYNSTWSMYKRIDNQWVFVTTLPGVPYGMSYDGNRIINRFFIDYQDTIDIYDYPWTSPPTQILISEPDLGNNNCTISPDGTLLVTFSNVYSLSDGSLVTNLPGYVYGPQSDLNISKDNKTIVKGFIGSELQVLDYPFTQVNAVLSPVSAYSFYGSPFISEDGSVIIGSDILLGGTDVYYKNFKSQPGLFLPSGTGGGDSGSGFYGDGSQIDPYFQFLTPKAYINGGFGNSYQYGTQGEGGFGGGQGPLNKSNKLTKFTISESPSTFSLGGNPQVVSVNSDATVMYYGTTRYLYSGGSWNYDQDFGYTGINGFLSVSDDGMTAVTYTTAFGFGAINNIPIGIVTGTQRYIVSGYRSRVNKQGTRVAYSVYPGPNVFIRDVPFTGGDYQLTLPASFPLDSNVSSFDFSSDGSVLAIGFNVGSTGYAADGALRILITRYPWTTYETINNVGNIVALSPDGQTLFAAVNSSDASFIYKYEYTSQSEWQRVSRTSSGYKNTIYLATGSDGSLFVKPSDISLYYSGYPSLVFNFTVYNGDFSQIGSVSNSYVSNMSSDGQHLVNYDGTSLKFYNKQPITVDTLVDHGFPQSYQVKYELTANYNGIHDITVTSANTFTFQGFCFANESGNLGTVSGVETGVSGGGGYTGSPGDGVSGATCYADSTVRNFTDLGAASNSAGYVTISLIDPAPIKQSTTLTPWTIQPTTFAPATTWSAVAYGSGVYVSVSYNGAFPVMYSTNGIDWLTNTTGATIAPWKSVTFGNGKFVAVGTNFYMYSTNGIDWIVTFGQWTATHIGNAGNYGSTTALSLDGSILAVGAHLLNEYAGAIFVYTYGNFSYVINFQSIYGGFGLEIAMSSDGTIIASTTNSNANKSQVYKNGTLLYDINTRGDLVALSSDGSVLAVCVTSYVNVYTQGSLTYIFDLELPSPFSIGLSSDGSILGVSYTGYTVTYRNNILLYTFYSGGQNFFNTHLINSDGTITTFVPKCGVTGYFNPDENIYYNTVYSINPIIPPGSWKSVAHGNGNFVSISDQSESVFSNDGVNWTLGGPVSDFLTSVTYGNDKFLAVGTTGDISYSLDGNTWSNVTTGTTSNSWTSVSYGNDRFVAISSNVTSMYSTDGITWATGGSIGASSNCLAFGNGYFVCPSSNSEVSAVSISTDGQTWTEIPLTYTPGVYSGVTYGTNGYVAVSPTSLLLGFIPTFWVSPTQVANSTKLNSTNWSGLAYGNGSFVAVGQGLIQTSKDYGNTWSSFQASDMITSVTYSNELGIFVALGSNSYSSTDGLTWKLNQAFQEGSNSLVYGNGQFVNVLDSNVSYSRDGINWNTSNNGTVSCSSVTYGGDKFSAVGENSSFMYSSDGIVWNSVVGDQVFSASAGSYFGQSIDLSSDGSVFAVSSASIYIPSGKVQVYINNALSYELNEITSYDIKLNSDGTILAVAADGPYYPTNVYTNGTLTYTIPESGPFDLSKDGNVIATCVMTDGFDFTGRVNVYTHGTLTYTIDVGFVPYYSFGAQIAVNSDGTIVAFSFIYLTPSYDPIGVLQVYTNGVFSYSLNERCGGVALNSDGSILFVGTLQKQIKVYKNQQFMYAIDAPPSTSSGSSYFGAMLEPSSDGTILGTGDSASGYGYVYKNGILTNSYPGIPSYYGTRIAMSSDGKIFAKGRPDLSIANKYIVSVPTGDWSSVTYGNGLFVAVSNPGGSMYSSDGINWFNGNAPTDVWKSVSYGDGFFVAVSENGTYPVLYSQDGINWSTTDPGSRFNNWGSVAFGGDTFLAIPTSGATTMTSRTTKTF